MNGEEMLGRCERIVAAARERGADQAEAYMEAGADLEVELERDAIGCTGTAATRGGSVRVVKDGRLGFAYFSDPDDGAKAVERALVHARLAPGKGYRLVPAGPPAALRGRFDPELALLDPDRAVAAAEELLAGVREAVPDAVLAGGGVGTSWEVVAIASSEGIACWDRATGASVAASIVVQDGDTAVSHGEGHTSHQADLDARRIGEAAAGTADSLRAPRGLGSGGRMDVVFRPDAVAELLHGLLVSAANGDDALRGKTVWSGRLGETVAHAGITVADDPLHPEAVGVRPFDGEGLPARRTPILEEGTLQSYLFDSWDANLHGRAGTHSAVRSGHRGLPQTGCQHLVVEGRHPVDFDRLVSGVDDGILVGAVLGAHTANATTGEFSVTAPNAWRIRGGAVEHPIKEVALAGDLNGLLQRVDGASRDARILDGARIPALRFGGLSVSV